MTGLGGLVVAPARGLVRLAGALPGRAVGNARRAAEELTGRVADRRELVGALIWPDGAGPGAADGDPTAGRLEVLDRTACLDLLARRRVGRLGYVEREGVVAIVPVNYLLDGDEVVVRSGPGPTLSAAERRESVAFEVDDVDEETGTGWSVLVVGRARRLTPAEERRRPLAPEPFAGGPRRAVVRVTPTRITGRRLH